MSSLASASGSRGIGPHWAATAAECGEWGAVVPSVQPQLSPADRMEEGGTERCKEVQEAPADL